MMQGDIRFKFPGRLISLTWLVLMALGGCASTGPDLSPGNPLPGIGLAASENTVLLSWSQDTPLARNLRPGARINVLAQYDTAYGPVVNEVLATASAVSGVNGVKLSLKDALNFTPSGPVCMRLAIGQRPIPVRIARLGESSSGFYYDEWTQVASKKSEKASLNVQINRVNTNIRNFSQTNPNFAKWQRENQIFNTQQCASITVVNEQSRPETALEGDARAEAAKRQCVALYDGFTRFKLPTMASLNEALANDQAGLRIAQNMRRDFEQYRPGKIYFPGSVMPIDRALDLSMMVNKEKLTAVQAGIVIEAYQACETEATIRFEESLRGWQEVSDADNQAARVVPLQKLCRARFARDETRQQRLKEFKSVKTKLESELASFETSSSLPKRKQLISYSCPAESY